MKERIGIIAASILFASTAVARDQKPDAVTLYFQADKLLTAMNAQGIFCPANSNDEFPKYYPPMGDRWMTMEKAAFQASAEARALAHQMRDFDHADWPKAEPQQPFFSFLNGYRNLANEVGDAALGQHVRGDDAAAIESILDLWHLADLTEAPPQKRVVTLLVSNGIRALCLDRLDIIASGINVTDPKQASPKTIQGLIDALLNMPDPLAEATAVYDAQKADRAGDKATPVEMDKWINLGKRVNAERAMSAMSLACHLYRAQHQSWPMSADDLRQYIPTPPVDPFGDGKETIGYVVIPSGLPDGTDRPMVYTRQDAKGALVYRTKEPGFSHYTTTGRERAKLSGQFRDVAAWPATGKVQSGLDFKPLQ